MAIRLSFLLDSKALPKGRAFLFRRFVWHGRFAYSMFDTKTYLRKKLTHRKTIKRQEYESEAPND